MDFVSVLVEGQTEANFAKNILFPYLVHKDISINPIIVKTRQSKGILASKKGGTPPFDRLKNQLGHLLQDTSASLITTMFDLYGLPDDYPGMSDAQATRGSCYQQASYLEAALNKQINHHRFQAYYAVHEMEALLFTEPAAILKAVGVDDTAIEQQLRDATVIVESPEEINRDAPPSKRILRVIPTYKKAFHIIPAAEVIGVDAMREACPHFDEWLQSIEAL